MKCRLKKQGMPELQIMQYLVQHGYLDKNAKPEKVTQDKERNVTETLHSDITDINEDTWRHCILRLINESETMTPAIVDKIRDYLDKKKAISQAEVVRIRPSLEDVNVFSQ
jgi:preprotein translocase subunit SecB